MVAGAPAAEGTAAYDWHGDYVSIAVKGGNVPVLKELLAGGYELKWQQAQVNSNSSIKLYACCFMCRPKWLTTHHVRSGFLALQE